MRRDEGMVRISLREWYVLTVGGSDHPSTPLVLIKCLAFLPNASLWAIIQLLGPPVTPIVTRSSVYSACKRWPVGYAA